MSKPHPFPKLGPLDTRKHGPAAPWPLPRMFAFLLAYGVFFAAAFTACGRACGSHEQAEAWGELWGRDIQALPCIPPAEPEKP